MNPKIEALLKAKQAERAANGLTIQTTRDGYTSSQSFKDTASRDKYIARAKRLGANAAIVEA